MSLYVYRARDTVGKVRTGTLRVGTLAEVREYLLDRGFTPIEVTQDAPESSWSTAAYRKEKIILFRELANYKQTAVPLAEIQRDLTQLFSANAKWCEIVSGFLADLTRGLKTSDAMAQRPTIFSQHEVSLMQTAFQAGKEPAMLLVLAQYLQRSDNIAGKIWQAAFYPIVLTVGLVVSSTIYSVVMLPQLMELYRSLNIEPVFPIPQILALITFLSTPVTAIPTLFALVLAIGALVAWARTPHGSIRLDRATMNAPLFGRLIFLSQLVRVLFILDLMLSSGQRPKAFEAALSASTGPVFRNAIKRCKTSLEEGRALRWDMAFAEAPEIFDPVLIGTIRSGERNGNLSDKLRDAISIAEARINDVIATLPERLQTAVTIVFTVIIGIFVYAMVVPTSSAVAHLH